MENNINTIREIKDIADDIHEERLVTSVNLLVHAWEHRCVDHGDVYNVLRDMTSLLASIAALRGEIESLA